MLSLIRVAVVMMSPHNRTLSRRLIKLIHSANKMSGIISLGCRVLSGVKRCLPKKSSQSTGCLRVEHSRIKEEVGCQVVSAVCGKPCTEGGVLSRLSQHCHPSAISSGTALPRRKVCAQATLLRVRCPGKIPRAVTFLFVVLRRTPPR